MRKFYFQFIIFWIVLGPMLAEAMSLRLSEKQECGALTIANTFSKNALTHLLVSQKFSTQEQIQSLITARQQSFFLKFDQLSSLLGEQSAGYLVAWSQSMNYHSADCNKPYPAQPGDYLDVIRIPLGIIRTSNDDGSQAAIASREQILQWLEDVNKMYLPAGIQFDFSTDDLFDIKNSAINRLTSAPFSYSCLRDFLFGTVSSLEFCYSTDESRDFFRALAPSLERLSRKMILIFRGDWLQKKQSSPGFSQTFGFSFGLGITLVPDQQFEAQDDFTCAYSIAAIIAHELGHELGLAHIFSSEPKGMIQSEDHQRTSDPTKIAAYDGDKIPDTPPIYYYGVPQAPNCGDKGEFSTFNFGVALPLYKDPNNIMSSGHKTNPHFSRGQIEILRQTSISFLAGVGSLQDRKKFLDWAK